jgi:ParB family transcriptional regulator, chromosome partitioning protein
MNDFGLTTSEVAVRVGKSVAYVSNSMRLLTLPDTLKDGLLSGQISEGHARALSSIEDPALIVESYKQVLREGASVRRTEEIARRAKSKANLPIKPRTRLDHMYILTEELDRMQNELAQALRFSDLERPEDTEVQLKRSKRQSKIVFLFNGSPEQTEAKLQKIYKAVTGQN